VDNARRELRKTKWKMFERFLVFRIDREGENLDGK
jgi:hypothetical protein